MGKQEINFIRPQEVYDVSSGDSVLRYRGYDGFYHHINTDENGGNIFSVFDMEKIFKPILTDKNIVSAEYPDFGNIATMVYLLSDYTEPSSSTITSNIATLYIDAGVDDIKVGDILIPQNVYGYRQDGTTLTNTYLEIVVVAVDKEEGTISCYAINGKKIGNFYQCVPSIDEGEALVFAGGKREGLQRMIRMLEKSCKMQEMSLSFEEESSVIKGEINSHTRLNNNEVAMLNEFVSSRNISFLFGVAGNNENPPLMGGVFWEAGSEFLYNASGLSEEAIDTMMRTAFSFDCNGSDQKILLGGSTLIKSIITNGGKKKIVSPYGVLDCCYCRAFDEMGHAGNGIILDPAYLKIYNKTPLRGEFKDGVMNFYEEAAILATNTRTHTRIINV